MRVEYHSKTTHLPRPGQFFTLMPPSFPSVLMRRPFAYSGADQNGFSFIYEIRGPVTQALSAMPDGAELDCIGPLGSAFTRPEPDRNPVLAAGGIGIGPLYFLAADLASAGYQPLLILGARSSELVPDLKWPDGISVEICTDDGSQGTKGTVVAALKRADPDNALFYTCGPRPMMAAVHRLAAESGCRCQVSVEEMMACGVGACQGCAVEINTGADAEKQYLRVCAEGPVFDSEDLRW